MKLNRESIGAPPTSYGSAGSTALDSGSPYTYLPSSLATKFKAAWWETTGFVYDDSQAINSSIDVTTLPVITFVLEKHVRILLPHLLFLAPFFFFFFLF
jgi:hypothetical protein